MPEQTPTRTTPAELLAEGIARASALGWRTISLRRLRALAAGDARQLPALPKTTTGGSDA